MQIIVPNQPAPLAHPIELMEQFVAVNEWQLRHVSPTEISVEIPERWSDYALTLRWQGKHAALHLNVQLDIPILASQMTTVREVISSMNSRTWLGHFDLAEEGAVIFRHTVPLRGAGGATPEQIEDLIDTTIGECERAYPALYDVARGVVSVEDAMKAAFMKTAGSA